MCSLQMMPRHVYINLYDAGTEPTLPKAADSWLGCCCVCCWVGLLEHWAAPWSKAEFCQQQAGGGQQQQRSVGSTKAQPTLGRKSSWAVSNAFRRVHGRGGEGVDQSRGKGRIAMKIPVAIMCWSWCCTHACTHRLVVFLFCFLFFCFFLG